MKSTGAFVAGGVIVVLTIMVGVVHGHLSRRWGTPTNVVAAGKGLEQVPYVIGDWHCAKPAKLPTKVNSELEESTAQMLHCNGAVSRIYENVVTGERVAVAVLLGPSGTIAVHTPEICYSSQDYQISAQRVLWKPDESATDGDELWDLRMEGKGVSKIPLRVLYGWTVNKRWQASKSPRFEFGGSDYLYKLQLSGPVPTDASQGDPCKEFLAVFLPELRLHMIP